MNNWRVPLIQSEECQGSQTTDSIQKRLTLQVANNFTSYTSGKHKVYLDIFFPINKNDG